MTQPEPVHPAAGHGHLIPETFWALCVRRSRYVLAIAASALVFCTVGWMAAAPPPEVGGMSLLVWSGGNGLLGSLLLVVLLLVMTAICSVLVHPDSPHMGLCCALVGMTGLAIRGGTVWTVIWYAQNSLPGSERHYRDIAQLLGVECLQWAIMIGIAEVFTRLLHDRFFANTRWMLRSGVEVVTANVQKSTPGLAVLGMSAVVSRTLRTDKLAVRLATPLAMILSGVLAAFLLAILMQSQLKGQVLMARFLAMYGATFGAYLAFPRVPVLALILAVPLTAAAGYFYAGTLAAWPAAGATGVYPGQAYFYMMRALPIDYICVGVPGAILGYYGAFWWSAHSHEE